MVLSLGNTTCVCGYVCVFGWFSNTRRTERVSQHFSREQCDGVVLCATGKIKAASYIPSVYIRLAKHICGIASEKNYLCGRRRNLYIYIYLYIMIGNPFSSRHSQHRTNRKPQSQNSTIVSVLCKMLRKPSAPTKWQLYNFLRVTWLAIEIKSHRPQTNVHRNLHNKKHKACRFCCGNRPHSSLPRDASLTFVVFPELRL